MNNVTVVGRLGGDAEQKRGDDGREFFTFSLAENRGKKKPGGGFTDATQWWNVIANGTVRENLRKGAIVMVFGDCEARGFTRQNGEMGVAMNLQATRVMFVAPGSAAPSVSSVQESERHHTPSAVAPSAGTPRVNTSEAGADDDLPF